MTKYQSNFDKLQAKQGLTAKNLSQMSKITPLGVSAAVEDARLAQVKTKLEARARNLVKVKAFVNRTAVKLSALSAMAEPQRMVLLVATLKKIQAVRANPKLPHGTSTVLRRLENEVLSLKEGVMSGAADERELVLLQAQALEAQVDKMIELAQLKLTAGTETTEADLMLDKAYDRAAEVIKKSGAEAKRLDSITNKRFVVARVPVVAITTPMINVGRAKSLGLKIEDLAGYPLIHNQLVLGINRKALDSGGKRPRKVEEVANELKAAIQTQVSQKLEFVTPLTSQYKDAIWFWLATAQDLNAIMKSAGGRLSLQRWGFGFN